MRILVVDTHTTVSVYNLVQAHLGRLDVACDVRRNGEIVLDEITALRRCLLSPGPGTPAQAGICMDLIGRFAGQVQFSGCAWDTRRLPRSTARR